MSALGELGETEILSWTSEKWEEFQNGIENYVEERLHEPKWLLRKSGV